MRCGCRAARARARLLGGALASRRKSGRPEAQRGADASSAMCEAAAQKRMPIASIVAFAEAMLSASASNAFAAA